MILKLKVFSKGQLDLGLTTKDYRLNDWNKVQD